MDNYPGEVATTMDQVDQFVHDNEANVCASVQQAMILEPLCCTGMKFLTLVSLYFY